jgi:sec-independent protein translocase protein TatB
MIQNFGGGEILVIIILALVVLGPERLPEMARNAGKMLHKFRTMTSGLQSQVRDVMDDPAMQPLRELGEFAARPRQKLSEYALEAEADERMKAEADSLRSAEAAGTAGTADGPDTTAPVTVTGSGATVTPNPDAVTGSAAAEPVPGVEGAAGGASGQLPNPTPATVPEAEIIPVSPTEVVAEPSPLPSPESTVVDAEGPEERETA